MKKIKELQKRSELNEGRSFGIGFSILKPITRSKFETYLPFTACRDYLNDFTYVESTKKEIGKIHGYNHKLLNCFENKRIFYLGVNTLHRNSGGKYEKFKELQNILINNYKNLELFLNTIENQLGIKIKTFIELDEDTLIIKCSKFWVKSTPLISVYTLLIRCYFNIDLTENKLTIDNLKNNKPFINADSMMKQPCIDFYEMYLDNKSKFINPDYNGYGLVQEGNPSSIHNFGIDGFIRKIKQ